MASWFICSIFLLVCWVWAVIQMSFGAWQATTFEGNWGHLSVTSNTTLSSWDDICTSSPYTYVRPFAFGTAQSASATAASKSGMSICPWDTSNSAFRTFWVVLQIIFLLLLTFKNMLSTSFLAKACMGIFSFMLAMAFAIDASDAINGAAVCDEGFAGTDLATALADNDITLTCYPYNFNGMVAIDFIALVFSLLLIKVWGDSQEEREAAWSGGQMKMNDDIPVNDA